MAGTLAETPFSTSVLPTTRSLQFDSGMEHCIEQTVCNEYEYISSLVFDKSLV